MFNFGVRVMKEKIFKAAQTLGQLAMAALVGIAVAILIIPPIPSLERHAAFSEWEAQQAEMAAALPTAATYSPAGWLDHSCLPATGRAILAERRGDQTDAGEHSECVQKNLTQMHLAKQATKARNKALGAIQSDRAAP